MTYCVEIRFVVFAARISGP